MECTLATLIACFSWGNLYLDAQISAVDRTVPYQYWKDVSPPPSNSVVETVYIWSASNESENPYMRNAIGYQLRFRAMDISAEIFHDSSMSSNKDRGVNGIAIRATWFPFR